MVRECIGCARGARGGILTIARWLHVLPASPLPPLLASTAHSVE